jgi:hypothetical protein
MVKKVKYKMEKTQKTKRLIPINRLKALLQ